jgi:hypothetical protein
MLVLVTKKLIGLLLLPPPMAQADSNSTTAEAVNSGNRRMMFLSLNGDGEWRRRGDVAHLSAGARHAMYRSWRREPVEAGRDG